MESESLKLRKAALAGRSRKNEQQIDKQGISRGTQKATDVRSKVCYFCYFP